MSCIEIARRLGYVSDRTVSTRIQSLIDRGIIKVTSVCNRRELGYSIIADISIEAEPRKVMEVAQALSALDRVSYVAIVAGDRDVSVQVNAADAEDLEAFITETVQAIPGVQRTRTYLLTRILKDIQEWTIPPQLP